MYYKLGQVLQIRAIITNWGIKTINFITSRDTEEERVMNSSGANIQFTSYNDGNKVVNELFKSILSRYQEIQKH